MAEVLLITKPVSEPYDDGSVVFARDLACCDLGGHTLRVMVPRGQAAPGSAQAEPIYPKQGGKTFSSTTQARLAKRLARVRDGVQVDHYVFAPNRRTSSMGFLAKHVRRRPVIHTVPSRPAPDAPLFADVHVAFSRDTARLLTDLGARDVRVIPPAVQVPSGVQGNRARFGIPNDNRAVLFAGDMTEPGGAETLAAALERLPDVIGVFAYRQKGGQVKDIETRVKDRLGSRALMLGQVDDMFALMRSVDLQCLAASDLSGKVDLPYVLLESMALGTPIAVGDMAPLNELGGESEGVVHVSYSPRELSRQLERLLKDDERLATLSRNCQRTAEERFSLAAMGRAYSSLYRELSA